jgi:branched-chain amino acid transport system permease protein
VDATIALFLVQDGILNGAIYALLAVALVLVFAVTRVILIPQGEFVAYGALTLAALEAGIVPGTVWLLAGLAPVAAALEFWRQRHGLDARRSGRIVLVDLVLPGALLSLAVALAPTKPAFPVAVLLTLALVAPLGPLLYRVAFQPLADAPVLVLLIVAVGVHLALTGLGLVFFGAEGMRTSPLSASMFSLGDLVVTGQSLAVVATSGALLLALWLFFDRTLIGKALRASAVNRIGARLVGIPTAMSGRLAFLMAAGIGAFSGILIGPVTTIYYDTGFLVGLKGFVAAIVGGLVSYPITVAAALVVGLVEAFASFGASAFKEVIVFMIILPVLLWRSLRGAPVEDED